MALDKTQLTLKGYEAMLPVAKEHEDWTTCADLCRKQADLYEQLEQKADINAKTNAVI